MIERIRGWWGLITDLIYGIKFTWGLWFNTHSDEDLEEFWREGFDEDKEASFDHKRVMSQFVDTHEGVRRYINAANKVMRENGL